MKRPPAVAMRSDHENPLDGFYSLTYGGKKYRWAVPRLIEIAKDLPVFDCPLAALNLSYALWTDQTMLEIANHVARVMKADLRFPIILDWEGQIADGRHRIIKALAEGRSTIKAVRLTYRPEPCGVEHDEN